VLKDAESYGLYLTADNRLIDTVAGDVLPSDVPLIKPMKQTYIDELTSYSLEEMRSRVIQPGDRAYSQRSLLCAGLPGGNAELSLAIGYGMTEDRRAVPRVHKPHSFNLAWLRATPGDDRDYGSDKGWDGVEPGAQHGRDLADQYVAQGPATHPGDRAQDHRLCGTDPEVQGIAGSCDREHAEARWRRAP
jgi:hypothetical protein